ncbi:MAG: heat-inducible transcriptional repressor HrcA [Deltaproteobacteria bacterium]|jgi:heat-inducible transcriptional repressor|nr:heat-inducible transcriptional repressor HrcA [Deltaproteobacteria bacterium]
MPQFQNQRQKAIFEAVVRDFIRTGEPVPSKNLADRYALNLSSASVRKVMAELEALGLLSQAHASAGRAPTEQGFKVYVDQILRVEGLPPQLRANIDRELANLGAEPIFTLLSRLLSELTSHVGLVMAPFSTQLRLKRLYFVRLGVRQALAVLAGENGLIRHRVLKPAEDFSQDELNEVNVLLEELAVPFTLAGMKAKLLEDMGQERLEYEKIFRRVLTLAEEAQAADEAGVPEEDIYLDDQGRGRLLEHPDFRDVEAMRALFRAFENKRRLVELLNEITGGGRVRVVIGPSGEDADGLALVASPYSDGLRGAGALGVLGPRRLNYAEIVPVVDYAARVVSGLMSSARSIRNERI